MGLNIKGMATLLSDLKTFRINPIFRPLFIRAIFFLPIRNQAFRSFCRVLVPLANNPGGTACSAARVYKNNASDCDILANFG